MGEPVGPPTVELEGSMPPSQPPTLHPSRSPPTTELEGSMINHHQLWNWRDQHNQWPLLSWRDQYLPINHHPLLSWRDQWGLPLNHQLLLRFRAIVIHPQSIGSTTPGHGALHHHCRSMSVKETVLKLCRIKLIVRKCICFLL